MVPASENNNILSEHHIVLRARHHRNTYHIFVSDHTYNIPLKLTYHEQFFYDQGVSACSYWLTWITDQRFFQNMRKTQLDAQPKLVRRIRPDGPPNMAGGPAEYGRIPAEYDRMDFPNRPAEYGRINFISQSSVLSRRNQPAAVFGVPNTAVGEALGISKCQSAHHKASHCLHSTYVSWSHDFNGIPATLARYFSV